jgi:hypothetical protein
MRNDFQNLKLFLKKQLQVTSQYKNRSTLR